MNIARQLFTSILICAACSRAATEPAIAVADVARELESIRSKYKLPALAAIALRGDTLVGEGYVGVRKLGADTPITPDDRFHLGSDTKAMTATLFGLVVERGKITWTTTLPEAFAGASFKLHPDWKDVTLAQVLAHRAGLRPNILPRQRDAKFMRLKMPERREIVLGEILSQPPTYAPGSKYEYSNVDYLLIGSVVEQCTGKSWEDALQEHVFKPLAITTAGFGPPGSPGKLDQPWGHSRDGTPMDPGAPGADNPRVVGPAGTAHMAMRDWAKFIALHLRGDARNPHREVKLLKAETFDALHTPATGETYTGGWIFARVPWAKGSREGDTGRALSHAGTNTMWFCETWIAPEIDFAVLVAMNQFTPDSVKACREVEKILTDRFARDATPSNR